MKLFEKILLLVLSIGVIFTSAFSLYASADAPITLEQCCSELDCILSQEEKDKIKNSPVEGMLCSYLRTLCVRPIGKQIYNWLLAQEGDSSGKLSKLADLLLEHGIDFDGDMGRSWKMVGVILENYRHYLLTGKSVTNLEELIIDFHFHCYHGWDSSLTREYYQEKMKKWKTGMDNSEELGNQVHSWWCNIM